MMTCEGFTHGWTYKIQSVFDGTVLDIKGGKIKDGNQIINWEYTGSANQQWIVYKESEGFRLASAANNPDNPLKVMDYAEKKGVIVWSYKGSLNQQFLAKPCGEDIFLVKCCHGNGNALRNQGRGNQVILVVPDGNDVSQQWRICPV